MSVMGGSNGGQQVLGMRSGSGHHGSQLSNNESRLSKKENDFQKLNKQSTMLYLHHNPNQVNLVA